MSEELKSYLCNIKYEIETSDIELEKLDLVLSAIMWKELLDYLINLKEQLHQASLDIQELTERSDNLQEENEKLNENKRHTLNAINRTIEIIKQQPTEDDSWILDRLDDFKYLLKGDKDE